MDKVLLTDFTTDELRIAYIAIGSYLKLTWDITLSNAEREALELWKVQLLNAKEARKEIQKTLSN